MESYEPIVINSGTQSCEIYLSLTFLIIYRLISYFDVMLALNQTRAVRFTWYYQKYIYFLSIFKA